MIAYQEHPETASYTWQYRGGCYENGEIAVYEKAKNGEEYTFNNVPIEVREDESQYTSENYEEVVGDTSTSSSSSSSSSKGSSGGSSSGVSSFFGFLSIVCLVGAGLSVALLLFFYFRAVRAGSSKAP
jgi:hypothetical protein